MRITMLAALATLCLSACRAAEPIKAFDVKLGLWENTSKTEMTGAPAMHAMPQIPEETLAKLPAEQRSQLETRMKGMAGPHTATAKSCVTQETLNRGINFAQNDKSCAYKAVSSSSTRQEIRSEEHTSELQSLR